MSFSNVLVSPGVDPKINNFDQIYEPGIVQPTEDNQF